ncbi:hypothetical protein PN462_19190 [Spirulina sp. CS-785/01]|uniref:hypothetical protein n=1 Tax=Spirulina sp. CS-785/01 TaxID=3021716 RepID=UPI00232E91C5|nr:hypothetical protein [Spirulina sp. CS-785/01]MDB9315248.1 hypothetical protein [Spirulina sp. CS-785/01]
MADKPLYDEYGVIREAWKTLPLEFRNDFLEALAELEDNECHRQRNFPKTQLHRIKGYEEAVYRAYIDKISGWRLHLMYQDGAIHLKDIIPPNQHDPVIKVIQSKEYRYKKKPIQSETKKRKRKKK